MPGRTKSLRLLSSQEDSTQNISSPLPQGTECPGRMLVLTPRAAGYEKRQSEPSATAPRPKIHPSPSQSQQEWIPASPPAPGGEKLAGYVRKRPGTALPRAARALPLKAAGD